MIDTNTILDVARRLRSKVDSSRRLTERALEIARDPEGEGRLTFLRLHTETAADAAAGADRLISSGAEVSRLCGVPISIKDLFDMEGEATTAGSVALKGRMPAQRDATCVGRIKRAGAVIVGRTNMTEFAYSGLGLNPHFGTPANPYDRKRRLIPGGSSSGAAISVSDGMCVAAIGSDTGGSIRIPAALCGLVGFKPTQQRIPLDGVFPLSFSLDSVGTIACSVGCCAIVDSVIAGEEYIPITPADLSRKRFAVPNNYFLDDLDRQAAENFDAALKRLSSTGATLDFVSFPEFKTISDVAAAGGLIAPEAFAYHRRLGTDFSAYDRRVAERIVAGGSVSAATYLDMVESRNRAIRTFRSSFASYDALLCPTVPQVAPEIAALESDADLFRRTNALFLRNTSVANFLDTCSLSIPSHRAGDSPTGLMLIAHHLDDRELLSLGLAIEQIHGNTESQLDRTS